MSTNDDVSLVSVISTVPQTRGQKKYNLYSLYHLFRKRVKENQCIHQYIDRDVYVEARRPNFVGCCIQVCIFHRLRIPSLGAVCVLLYFSSSFFSSSFILLFEVFSFNTLERVVFRTFSESPNFIVVYEYSRVLGLSRAIQRESRCNEETLSSEDHNDFMSGSSVRFRVSRRLIFRRNLAPALLFYNHL